MSIHQPLSVLDTTLRDGEQGEGISFTVKDKLAITELLDSLGIDYIEGGWPGSNPKAMAYFKEVTQLSLTHSKIAAFGSTRRANIRAEDDPSLKTLRSLSQTVKVIFGKTWDFHVTDALSISLEENLSLIEDSIRYLKEDGSEVIFDAEHFFDGYKNNPEYSLECILTAQKAGANILCLCDTNGGSLPSETKDIITDILPKVSVPLGIHAHNDSGLGTAVALAAVDAGATHIQGTLNGYGERCGNANLSSILPTLALKTKVSMSPISENLRKITHVSHAIDEIANVTPNHTLPYVGKSAFAHKGGIHVSAILKQPETYEHTPPESVGNERRILVSDLSGASNLIYKAEAFGLNLKKGSPELNSLLGTIKEMEHLGYQFEGADASLNLLMRKTLGLFEPSVVVERFRIINEGLGKKTPLIEAAIKAKVSGKEKHIVTEGNGPLSALDRALRAIMESEFPITKKIKLIDYKVRVLNATQYTDANVRVLITSSDGKETWRTVGVSSNIIEASWHALMDSFEYYIMESNNDN